MFVCVCVCVCVRVRGKLHKRFAPCPVSAHAPTSNGEHYTGVGIRMEEKIVKVEGAVSVRTPRNLIFRNGTNELSLTYAAATYAAPQTYAAPVYATPQTYAPPVYATPQI